MGKSIMQDEKICYITGDTMNLHKHHIFGAANRKLSEQYGLWIWLRADWHNLSNYGIHFNKTLDADIKRKAQEKFNSFYPQLSFIKLFGKNYL
jgi:hypothetical protein